MELLFFIRAVETIGIEGDRARKISVSAFCGSKRSGGAF